MRSLAARTSRAPLASSRLGTAVALALGLMAMVSCGWWRGPPSARTRETRAPSCAVPLTLRPGTSARASTQLGRDALRASCVRGSAPECVYVLDVSDRAELRVSLESSDFDGALALYSEAGTSSPRELRCVDDTPSGDPHHARIEVAVSPGRYLIAVDGANGEAGEFELFAELEPLATTREACTGARPLVAGVSARDSTRGGANLFSATCGGGAQGPEHVRNLMLERTSRVRIRQQAEFDGSLYLRADCEDPSSELACNDDFQGNARSSITARLEAGRYYVFSDSYSREQSGDYVITLERVDEPEHVTAEALCRAAERGSPLTAGEHELDTLHGSSELGGSCGGTGAPELLFPLRVEAPTQLVAVLEDAELNAVIYLRRSCADASSELACYTAPRIDRAGAERDSSPPGMVAPLERGSYVLVVDGAEPSDMGAATLQVLFKPVEARAGARERSVEARGSARAQDSERPSPPAP